METLSRDALDWSLSHIERFGDTDFFPLPFEFAAIRHCWDRIRGELLALDLEDFRPRPPRRIGVAKPIGGFRIVSQLDPLDALVYAALVYECCGNIEASRVPASRRIACSYRIVPKADGALFAERSGWPEFHEQSTALAASGNYGFVLLADITDFYNQASHHRIENALNTAGISDTRARSVEEFLLALAAKQSRGLPVGPSASIVLAEACLNDVDLFLLRRGLTHTRYVDDYRIFCRDNWEALWTLHELCDYLYTAHRLALNPTKTMILTCEDFVRHELLDPEEEEERGRLARMSELIESVMQQAGGYGAFEDVTDFEELVDDEEKRKAVGDNIAELFDRAIAGGNLHVGIARHILRRAAHLRTTVIHNVVFENLSLLTPVMRDVAQYIAKTPKASLRRGNDLAEFLLNAEHGKLPFSRIWGLEAANHVEGMLDNEVAMQIAADAGDPNDIRCAAQIAKRARLVEWVRERKESWASYGPWQRRGVIFSATALSRRERDVWLSSVESSGDSLDKAVAQYVRSARRKTSGTTHE